MHMPCTTAILTLGLEWVQAREWGWAIHGSKKLTLRVQPRLNWLESITHLDISCGQGISSRKKDMIWNCCSSTRGVWAQSCSKLMARGAVQSAPNTSRRSIITWRTKSTKGNSSWNTAPWNRYEVTLTHSLSRGLLSGSSQDRWWGSNWNTLANSMQEFATLAIPRANPPCLPIPPWNWCFPHPQRTSNHCRSVLGFVQTQYTAILTRQGEATWQTWREHPSRCYACPWSPGVSCIETTQEAYRSSMGERFCLSHFQLIISVY